MKRFALLRNALKPAYVPVIAGKILTRVTDRKRTTSTESELWAETRAIDVTAFCNGLSEQLWSEAEEFASEFADEASRQLANLDVTLGGGGHYPLLYFLTRLLRPEYVVETGVAAGYSSAAILTALARNNAGKLWSSDFPYFRLDQPEKYVGCLVDNDLRDRWRLLISGDRANMPIVASEVAQVDLFHYDSDKSYRGRKFAVELLLPLLTREAIVIMDDIQDNEFFQDLVQLHPWDYRVVSFAGKYVGMTGPGMANAVRPEQIQPPHDDGIAP